MIESALKVDLCDIKDITELLIVLLGCFLNQSFNPVVSWFLLRNGGKVSIAMITPSEPVSFLSLPDTVMRVLW